MPRPCKYGERTESGKCPPKPKTPKTTTRKAKPCKYGERDESGKCPPKPKTTTRRHVSVVSDDSPVPVKDRTDVKIIVYYKNKKILDKRDNTTMHERDVRILEDYFRHKFGSGSPDWIDDDFVIRNVPYDAERKSIRKIVSYQGVKPIAKGDYVYHHSMIQEMIKRGEMIPVYGENYPVNTKMLDEKLQSELNEEGEMQNWGKIYVKYTEI